MSRARLEKLAWCRNGMFGEGYYLIKFKQEIEGRTHDLIGVVFDDPHRAAGEVGSFRGRVAVFDINAVMLGILNPELASYRAEDYEGELRQFIAQHEAASGIVRDEPPNFSTIRDQLRREP